eukprot:3621888-Alexandrium_andersonii.AAC.1
MGREQAHHHIALINERDVQALQHCGNIWGVLFDEQLKHFGETDAVGVAPRPYSRQQWKCWM